jgi:O-antigen/teichoic acid export membrane protein
MNPLEETRNLKNISNKVKRQQVILKPFSKDNLQQDDIIFSIDTQPTLVTPTTSDTCFSIDTQPTLVTPTIKDLIKVSKIKNNISEKEEYISVIRKLVKSSGIYTLASFASPLISLALMPFLTHSLSTNDFGVLAVVNTAISLLAGISQFGLNNAFFRTYSLDYEARRDRLQVVSTVVILLFIISITFSAVTMFAAPWLSYLLLKNSSYDSTLRLAAFIVLLQNLTVPGFSWLRVENRAMIYSVLTIINLLFELAGTVLFVGVFHMGLNGALFATGGGFALIVLCTLPFIIFRVGLSFRFDISWNLLSFGLPLVANFVSVWILQVSDRSLLSHFGSLAQTASYTAAYSLGGVLNIAVQSPFSLAWPSAMFAIAKREDAPRVFQLVFRWYSILLLFAAFAFSIISTMVFYIFFPPTYYSSASIVSIITISIMFYAIYNFLNTGISVKRKTWFAVIFTFVAALTNIGFNLVLIPSYGAMGAALSTFFAYFLLAIIAYIVNQRVYPIPYEIGTFTIALTFGLGFYVIGSLLAQRYQTYTAWGIMIGALGIYGLCLVGLGIVIIRKKH